MTTSNLRKLAETLREQVANKLITESAAKIAFNRQFRLYQQAQRMTAARKADMTFTFNMGK